MMNQFSMAFLLPALCLTLSACAEREETALPAVNVTGYAAADVSVTANTGKIEVTEVTADTGMEANSGDETEEIEEVELILTDNEVVYDHEAASADALKERLERAVFQMLTVEAVHIELSEEGANLSIKVGDGVMPTDRQKNAVKKLVGKSVAGLTADRITLETEVP